MCNFDFTTGYIVFFVCQLETWLNTVTGLMSVYTLGLAAVYNLPQWNQKWVDLCENLADNEQQPFIASALFTKPVHFKAAYG